jgi:hypothetical protein
MSFSTRTNGKRILVLALCLSVFSSVPSICWAEDPPFRKSEMWSGHLIDISCAVERGPAEPDLGKKHTRRCLQMPSCDQSGFGLLLDGRQLLHFDDPGNQMTRKLISRTSQKDDLRVVVYGIKVNDLLQVKKIRFEPAKK